MKPLYVKKNGVVYKISGNGMPALYPAENVEYDNTVTSELQATDVQGAIDEVVGTLDDKIDISTKGVANGVAELDAAGKVPSSQLPSFVDDVIEVADYDHLPITGESGKIYVTLDTNKTYRWTGSGYAEISESLVLGETSSTAYRGDRGKTAYDHATETKLSTATASGLYKVAATAQGHISSLTAVQKSDITALGIPGSDTDTKNTAYGTCDTAGDVKDKVATLVNATNWSLEVGTIVGIRFTYTNTYTNQLNSRITLNINNTGAKTIRYSDDIWTSSFDKVNPTAYGESGQTIYYMYDGTYWVWASHSKDNDTLYNFKGNEFRSADANNYGLETGYGGNANYMVVNGHYYYNSNGPSTDIGASANDGAIYVQALDEDNVTQIAQNYENGNIFVRSKVNGSWTEWKKTIANITGNNTILSTDKTPFLTRQTLNPTGFSGYVREKLVGASYAWNQLVQNGNFADGTTGWQTSQCSISASSNILTATHSQNTVAGASFYKSFAFINGHKYYFGMTAKQVSANSTNPSKVLSISLSRIGASNYLISNVSLDTWYKVECIAESTVSSTQIIEFGVCSRASATGSCQGQAKEVQIIDLTLAFGSTIADYLYGLSNNGGITKLRDMGCPIDSYTAYGNYLISSKTSGKKIVGKNLVDPSVFSQGILNSGSLTESANWITTDFIPTFGEANITIYSYQDGTKQARCVRFSEYDASFNFIKDTANIWNKSGNFISVRTLDEKTRYIRSSHGFENLACTPTEYFATNRLMLIYGNSTTESYEPYTSTTYPIGNDELRGKFDLVNGEIVASGDVKESNGEITRNYGIVDLGSFTWQSSNGIMITTTAPTNAKPPASSTTEANIVCAKYSRSTASYVYNKTFDKIISLRQETGLIYAYDSTYTDATAFKTAMSGIYLIYELATPTTEQSTPFADPMSLVGATAEEYIDPRDIPCPVGAERQYMGQSEDVVEIPSSPQSDGKRILISEVSGGKEQVYWDSLTKLNYHDYTVKGDGTTTWGDLLSSLRPIYESLSEDEKTFSKLIFRPESISGNECLSYCGAYWYSRMGLNSNNKALWIDHASLGPGSSLTYYYQKNGDTFIDKTSETTTRSLSLRVFVEVGSNS